MSTMSSPGKTLVTQLRNGEISRRKFARAAAALGMAPALITAITSRVVAQDATPEDMEDVFATDGRPFDDGTENQTRGEGGEVRIIQYQAASILSPHVSTGYKDYDAARLVVEPLLDYLPDAQLYGVLLDAVPSL